MSSKIEALLSRLDRVKQTRTCNWLACCPAHDDKSPSLGITEKEDGRILIHCWSGCSASEVVESVSLTLADLFPDNPEFRKSLKPHERWIPRDVIKALADDALFVAVCAEGLANDGQILASDKALLLQSARRFRAAASEVGLP